jgi:hypothetical protein
MILSMEYQRGEHLVHLVVFDHSLVGAIAKLWMRAYFCLSRCQGSEMAPTPRETNP